MLSNSKPDFREIMSKIVIVFLSMCVLILLVSQVFFMYSKVPSGSMSPTIKEGEYVLIKRTNHIEHGDIVAFYSEEFSVYMLKRCIGMEGDIVDIREGNVYVNGIFLQENYVLARSSETKTFVVPEDSYFFLGDNRANSLDSREWSTPFIAQEDVVGKLCLRLYPILEVWK